MVKEGWCKGDPGALEQSIAKRQNVRPRMGVAFSASLPLLRGGAAIHRTSSSKVIDFQTAPRIICSKDNNTVLESGYNWWGGGDCWCMQNLVDMVVLVSKYTQQTTGCKGYPYPPEEWHERTTLQRVEYVLQ